MSEERPTRSRRPALAPDERRRRLREAALIGGALAAFLAFVLFETRVPDAAGGQPGGLGNVTFFVLINLNLILLLLLVFLVARNLAKLILERRQRIFGSRLRTRLVLAFVSLTLVPAVLLFVVAQGFVSNAIELWLSARVDRALQGALAVHAQYYAEAGNRAAYQARRAAEALERNGLVAQTPERLERFTALWQRRLDLDQLEIVRDGQRIAVARGARAAVLDAPAPDLTGVSGEAFAETIPRAGGDLVRAGAVIHDAAGAPVGAAVVTHVVPAVISEAAAATAQSNAVYRDLEALSQPMENAYTLSFLLMTLVVLFSATWFGIYVAKGITVPIQRLGEGMREVAQGNWHFRAKAGGDEEVATLVDDFNRMAADLETIHGALEERHQIIERIVAHITAGVVAVDEDRVVTIVNPAASALLGVPADEMLGAHWDHVVERGAVADVAALATALDATPSVERQLRLRGRGGMRTVWLTGSTLSDDEGQRRGFILFFEDVTDLLRIERMEAWREVARRIAHEIKNPLTPIQLSAQRLQKRYGETLGSEEGAPFAECTRTIIAQVEQLKRLVNEFSRFARLPAAQLERQDLNAVVEASVVLYREAHPAIDFAVALDPHLPPVELDREAIQRALGNLLDNAVAACQADAQSARVDVATTFDPALGIVRLEVADNGCGMTPEVKARATEPYFSTKGDGTGLGLAIVASIAAEHRAYLRIQDNPDGGTRMVIEFPTRRVDAAASA